MKGVVGGGGRGRGDSWGGGGGGGWGSGESGRSPQDSIRKINLSEESVMSRRLKWHLQVEVCVPINSKTLIFSFVLFFFFFLSFFFLPVSLLTPRIAPK